MPNSARNTDPLSSHIAVQRLESWVDLPTEIIQVFKSQHPKILNDTELSALINERRKTLKLTPVQRNNVARVRYKLEHREQLVRINAVFDDNHLLYFCLPHNKKAIDKYGIKNLTPRRHFKSVNLQWCKHHNNLWLRGKCSTERTLCNPSFLHVEVSSDNDYHSTN